MCKATIPHLLDGGGVIVNTASTAGLYGQPWSAAYCGSKGGVVLMTKALAYEYEETALRVNAVAPGGVETPIQKDFYDVPEGGDGRKLFKMMSRKGMCTPRGGGGHVRLRRLRRGPLHERLDRRHRRGHHRVVGTYVRHGVGPGDRRGHPGPRGGGRPRRHRRRPGRPGGRGRPVHARRAVRARSPRSPSGPTVRWTGWSSAPGCRPPSRRPRPSPRSTTSAPSSCSTACVRC